MCPNKEKCLIKKSQKSQKFLFQNRSNFWKKKRKNFCSKINSPKWCRWNTYTSFFCPRFTLVIFSNRSLRVATYVTESRVKSELPTSTFLALLEPKWSKPWLWGGTKWSLPTATHFDTLYIFDISQFYTRVGVNKTSRYIERPPSCTSSTLITPIPCSRRSLCIFCSFSGCLRRLCTALLNSRS